MVAVTMNWRLAWAVGGLAVVLRLIALAVVFPELKPDVDLDYYRTIARNLASDQGFTVEGWPDVARTPVYPLFLAGLIHLGGDHLLLFLIAQCLLGATTCVLTVWVARHWLSVGASIVAGLVVAVDLNSILRCLDLRTETLFTALVVAGAGLLIRKSDRGWNWLGAGWLWAVAALCRPIAIFLPAVACGFWVAERRPVRFLGFFLVGFIPLLTVWMTRNAGVSGVWSVSTISTINLLEYHAAAVEAARTGQPLEAVRAQFAERFGSAECVDHRPEFPERLRQMRQAAWHILSGSPGIAIHQTVMGWVKTALGPGTRSLDNSRRAPSTTRPWWAGPYVAVWVGLWGLSGWGCRSLGRAARLPGLLILYFIILAGGITGNSRFRTPLVPAVAILSIAGAGELLGRISTGQRARP